MDPLEIIPVQALQAALAAAVQAVPVMGAMRQEIPQARVQALAVGMAAQDVPPAVLEILALPLAAVVEVDIEQAEPHRTAGLALMVR
jgi:hypothetical protein